VGITLQIRALKIRALHCNENHHCGVWNRRAFYARNGPIQRRPRVRFGGTIGIEAAGSKLDRQGVIVREDRTMKLLIEIAAAALLIICITVTSAAFAGPGANGLICSFSAPQDASPAARCAAIKRQCGGKFYANYCGDKMLSAVR